MGPAQDDGALLPFPGLGVGFAESIVFQIRDLLVAVAGGPPMTPDFYDGWRALVADEVDLLFLNVRTASMGIDAGTIRPLAVTGPQRLDRWPDVPTMAESGFPGIGITHWHGLFASSGVARDTLRALHHTAVDALGAPAVRDAFRDAGVRPTPSASSEEFAADLRAEMAQWGAVRAEIGLARGA